MAPFYAHMPAAAHKLRQQLWQCRSHSDCVLVCSQGNSSAGVSANPSWQPLLTTVPEPDYPSGHGTLSGVAEAVLRKCCSTSCLQLTSLSCQSRYHGHAAHCCDTPVHGRCVQHAQCMVDISNTEYMVDMCNMHSAYLTGATCTVTFCSKWQ